MSENRLIDFLNNSKFVPPPSECPTRTWIGGSTFHKCVNNPESFIKSLSYSFYGNTATRWGNAFEEVTKHYLEKTYGIKIYTPRSIVGIEKDGNIILSYTPDGLTMYKGKSLDKLNKSINEDVNDELFILHEYKSPYSRIPNGKWDSKTNGYLSQIKTGLCIIPADFALYYDCVYRICDYYDLGNNSRQILCPNQVELETTPLSYGMMFFLIDKEYPCYDVEIDIINKPAEEQINRLYEGYRNMITNVKWAKMLYKKIVNINMKDVSILDFTETFCKKLDKYYDNVFITSNEDVNENFKEVWEYAKKEKKTPVGFVPWKLMYMKQIKVEREPDFVSKHLDTLIDVCSTMRDRPGPSLDF